MIDKNFVIAALKRFAKDTGRKSQRDHDFKAFVHSDYPDRIYGRFTRSCFANAEDCEDEYCWRAYNVQTGEDMNELALFISIDVENTFYSKMNPL